MNRIKKKYFAKEPRQQQRDKKRIFESLQQVQREALLVGLKFRKVEIIAIEDDERVFDKFEVEISEKENLTNSKPLKVLKAKDLAYLSDNNYGIFKKTAELKDLPSLNEIKEQRYQLKQKFPLQSNLKGLIEYFFN